ncbi:hypothetical protein AAEX28_12380 [Lentisphaerota bacterium WC36G]|nr:hypothetical protein LJT99_15210 [Lentisphaerae bacterium WC36]
MHKADCDKIPIEGIVNREAAELHHIESEIKRLQNRRAELVSNVEAGGILNCQIFVPHSPVDFLAPYPWFCWIDLLTDDKKLPSTKRIVRKFKTRDDLLKALPNILISPHQEGEEKV